MVLGSNIRLSNAVALTEVFEVMHSFFIGTFLYQYEGEMFGGQAILHRYFWYFVK